MQMVDDTREDDLFITRLQEEFEQADTKWTNTVTKISQDFLDMKKDLVDDKNKQEIDDLKGQCHHPTMGQNRKKKKNMPSNYPRFHEQASKRASAAERASEASERARCERTSGRVTQYFRLGFWLIWPTVHPQQLH